jgi:hypothetical protein
VESFRFKTCLIWKLEPDEFPDPTLLSAAIEADLNERKKKTKKTRHATSKHGPSAERLLRQSVPLGLRLGAARKRLT